MQVRPSRWLEVGLLPGQVTIPVSMWCMREGEYGMAGIARCDFSVLSVINRVRSKRLPCPRFGASYGQRAID